MPDEKTTQGTSPPSTTQDVETLEVDFAGRKMTVAELKEQTRHLQAGFTQKTQALAREKEELAAERSRIEGEAKFAEDLVTAQDRDIAWYRSHPAEEWDGYQSEVLRLRGGRGAGGNTTSTGRLTPSLNDPVTAKTLQTLERIDQRMEREEKSRSDKETEGVIKQVYEQITTDLGKFPLADMDMVLDQVEIFQSRNKGALPALAEVTRMVQSVHRKIESKGARVPAGTVLPEASQKARVGGNVSTERRLEAKPLKGNEVEAAGELTQFLLARAAARGG